MLLLLMGSKIFYASVIMNQTRKNIWMLKKRINL